MRVVWKEQRYNKTTLYPMGEPSEVYGTVVSYVSSESFIQAVIVRDDGTFTSQLIHNIRLVKDGQEA